MSRNGGQGNATLAPRLEVSEPYTVKGDVETHPAPEALVGAGEIGWSLRVELDHKFPERELTFGDCHQLFT